MRAHLTVLRSQDKIYFNKLKVLVFAACSQVKFALLPPGNEVARR